MGSSRPKKKSEAVVARAARGKNPAAGSWKVSNGQAPSGEITTSLKNPSLSKGDFVARVTRKPMGEVGPLDIIRATREGFPRTTLEELARTLEIEKVAELDTILNVSKRSLQRYEAGPKDESLSVELSDHILQVVNVYERALEVFGNRGKALRWLKSPIMALGQEVPLSLLDTSAGVEMVMDELGRFEHGIFA